MANHHDSKYPVDTSPPLFFLPTPWNTCGQHESWFRSRPQMYGYGTYLVLVLGSVLVLGICTLKVFFWCMPMLSSYLTNHSYSHGGAMFWLKSNCLAVLRQNESMPPHRLTMYQCTKLPLSLLWVCVCDFVLGATLLHSWSYETQEQAHWECSKAI